jgi:hypothetical protein
MNFDLKERDGTLAEKYEKEEAAKVEEAHNGVDYSKLDPISYNPHVSEINSLTLSTELGDCADLVTRKATFIKKFKSFKVTPTLSSTDFQFRIDEVMADHERGGMLPEDVQSKAGTRTELCATNIGVLPQNKYDGPDPLVAGKNDYMLCIDAILNQARASMKRGFEMAQDDTHYIKFNETSSVGMIGYEGKPEFDCTRDSDYKGLLLEELVDPLADRKRFSKSLIKVIGYRQQIDTTEKAPKRPALVFGAPFSKEMYETHVTNDYLGARVRHVVGFSWVINRYLMVYNQLIFLGLTDVLKSFWKFTHDDITDGRLGAVVVCTDVSNNDHNFPIVENEYIHRNLLDAHTYSWWNDAFFGPIYGAYIDDVGATRYYKTEKGFKPPLLSGEGLTSIINKIKHTGMQLYNHMLVRKIEFTENNVGELMVKLAKDKHLLNNGDDTLDLFDTIEMAKEFEVIATSNPYATIGLEPPGFSGISLTVDEEGRLTGKYSNALSFFIKGIEKERRNYDSPLGSLPYSSYKGKVDFLRRYPGYDPAVLDFFEDTYAYMLNFSDEERANIDELAKEEQGDDTKAMLLHRLMERLNITSPDKLYYEFSVDEMMKADPEACKTLFITLKIKGLFWPGLESFLTDIEIDNTFISFSDDEEGKKVDDVDTSSKQELPIDVINSEEIQTEIGE